MRNRRDRATSYGLSVVILWCLLPCLAQADPPLFLEQNAVLTLQRAIEIAFAHHPVRLAAQSRVGAARERVGVARSSLLPQITGATSYLRATNNSIGATVYPAVPGALRGVVEGSGENKLGLSDTFNNYLGSLSAYQFLLDFGRRRGFVSQRDAEADAERARLQLVELDLVFLVTRTYFDLLASKERVRVFEKAIEQRPQQLQRAELKARAGLVSEIDSYTARAELARAQLSLTDARNAVATTKLALDNAMGIGLGGAEYTQADPLTREGVSGSLETYLERALAQRPDLRMLEDEARAAGAEIKQYQSDYWPTIGAVSGVNVRGQTATPGTNYYAGVVLTWPLFNGFLTEHELAEARFRQDAVRRGIEDLRQRIGLEVKSVFLDCQATLQRIAWTDRSLIASRAELEVAEKRYARGLGSTIELTNAERRFTEDEAALVRALADLSINKGLLARNVGERASAQ
jgi:outer membrane protein